MKCRRRLKIVVLLILFAASIVYNTPLKTQPKYTFDFDSDWDWIQLMYGEYNISNNSYNILESFFSELNIQDARIIFRSLIRLDSLNEIREIYKVAREDSPDMSLQWESRLDSVFKGINADNDLDGLIIIADKIWQLKKTYSAEQISGKLFTENKFDAKIYDTSSVKLNTIFQYSEAYNTLDRIEKKTADIDSGLILRTGLSPDSIDYYFNKGADNSPLYTIYKMINPQCFKGLGGISLYSSSIKKVLNEISSQENFFNFEIKNKLFEFLPRSVYTKINVNFCLGFSDISPFAEASNIVKSESDNIKVPLEYFGDDYQLLIKYITRKLFLFCREQIYYNLLPYVLSGKDTTLGDVLSMIQEGGMLNYIAPMQLENRPISLLEKDFMHFRRTIVEIRKGTNKSLIDTLVQTGLSGNGLFYTMGTQMTFSIEKVIGKQAVKNSIIFGPIYFFANYIEAYKEDPVNIREIFRFSELFENSIKSIESKLSEEMIFDATNLITKKNLFMDKPEKWKDSLIANIISLEVKYKSSNNKYLLNCLIGEMLYHEKFYADSYLYFSKAIPDIKDKTRILRMLYKNFYFEKAYNESLSIAKLFIEYNSSSPEGYIYAGESSMQLNDLSVAEEYFNKALSNIHSEYDDYKFRESAEQYLHQIKNK